MPEHPEPAWGKSAGLLVPNLEPSGPTGAGGPGGCKPAGGLPSGIGHDGAHVGTFWPMASALSAQCIK